MAAPHVAGVAALPDQPGRSRIQRGRKRAQEHRALSWCSRSGDAGQKSSVRVWPHSAAGRAARVRARPMRLRMNAMHRALIRLAAISCVVIAHAASASAQTTVLVRVDQSTIWTHDFRSPAAVVRAGSILTVVGERKDWYEVVVPGLDGLKGETGFIFKPFVADAKEAVRLPARSSPPSAVARARMARPRQIGFAGFGQFGYSRFSAQNSFQAITGAGGGAVVGGGAEVRIGSLFLGGSHRSLHADRPACAGHRSGSIRSRCSGHHQPCADEGAGWLALRARVCHAVRGRRHRNGPLQRGESRCRPGREHPDAFHELPRGRWRGIPKRLGGDRV